MGLCCLGMVIALLASGQNSLLSHPLHQLDRISLLSFQLLFFLLWQRREAMFQLHVPIALLPISSTTIYWAVFLFLFLSSFLFFFSSCSCINKPPKTYWLQTAIILFAHSSLIWSGLSWEFFLLVLPVVTLVAAFTWQIYLGLNSAWMIGWLDLSLQSQDF